MADLVPPAIQPICKKRGFASADIFINWSSIVGQRFAETVRPEKITWPRKTSDGDRGPTTLVVRTDSATSIYLEYEKTQFVERINSFFGWPVISRIKIVNHPVPQKHKVVKTKQRELNQTEKQQLELQVEGISSERLKKALLQLGKDIVISSKPVMKAELD